MLTISANYQLLHIYHSTISLFPQGFERISKIQKRSVEEGSVDKAEADAEPEMDGGVLGTELGMWDG